MTSAEFAQDRLYPTDNVFEIPTLRLDRQPTTGLLRPFGGWGCFARRKIGIATYHFYVDDYRFNNIWLHPEKVVITGCQEVVEPNFSLFDTTPVAFGLQLLYKKRWIARWLQEAGIRVWVDLNVSPKFREYNRLGVPDGYNAFATRGNGHNPAALLDELNVAQTISGLVYPNMFVYGGGEEVKALCQGNGLIYVPDYMTQRRKEGSNG